MKFIRFFFLLAVVLIIKTVAFAHNSNSLTARSLADTIIKLDTLKDRKVLRKKPLPVNDTVNRSSFKSIGKATSDDSSYTDRLHNISYLWGNAKVTYEDFELNADFIRIDENKHLIFASGLIDPKTHRYTGRPISIQKGQKPAISDSIYFDYKTKRAKAYNTSTEQEGNFITGGQAKVLNDQEVAYRNIIFSTCNLPYPETHFGIVITRGIGEKKQIISGPAYLEIEGVPLPLGVPFGFFPKPDHQTSGVLLPTFGEDARLGFFLRNIGYYLAFGDHLDLTTYATLYSRGAFELSTTARYLQRYKYQGSFTFSFGSHNYGLAGDPATKDFNLQWSHSQDPNAHPGTTFSASVNAGTSSFYRNNPATTNYNPQQLVQSSLRSSIAYGKVWAGTPFSLQVALSHTQNIADKTITLELPSVNFNMTTISPFDSKNRVGEQRWFQRITVGYSLQGTNRLNSFPESQLFNAERVGKRLQSGVLHTIPLSFNQTVAKYFQFNTSATYIDHWNFQTVRRSYPRGATSNSDYLVDTISGFRRAGEYNLSAGVSTKVYSYLRFSKKSEYPQLRLVSTPSISFNYRPDYTGLDRSYNQAIVSAASVPYPYFASTYSIFEQSAVGGPTGGRSAGIGFSLDNTLEAKVKPRSTDTSGAARKVAILQGFTISTFYNFAADSFRLSPINLNAHTAVFNQKLGINAVGTLDPYSYESRDSVANGQLQRYVRRVNEYSFLKGKFPLLTALSLSMDVSLNSATLHKVRNIAPPGSTVQNMTQNQAERLALINSDPAAFVDFNIPWNIVLNYNFNYANNGIQSTVASTVNASGDFNLTPKWKIQYTTGYDLRASKVSLTTFSIYRDLHCWDLSFRWVPFGLYKSFSVDLKVKASILQDLKLSKRKDYYNNQ
ncbi:putative LPS assembly protein LptD [Mucilaginibacter koreensis]